MPETLAVHVGLLQRVRLARLERQRTSDFSGLDDATWAELILQEQSRYPRLAARLPRWPSPEFQRSWVGTDGRRLAHQSVAFYGRVKAAYARWGPRPIKASRILDYGCGFGRILRYFIKDSPHLHGCDINAEVLDMARQLGVPADLKLMDPGDEEPPFQGIHLVVSFSVLTHLSEAAHRLALRKIHRCLAPGGVAVVTVRPPSFAELAPALARSHPSGYTFAPLGSVHDQVSGAGSYGDAIITLDYIRREWSSLFDMKDSWIAPEDPYQRVVVLVRREA